MENGEVGKRYGTLDAWIISERTHVLLDECRQTLQNLYISRELMRETIEKAQIICADSWKWRSIGNSDEREVPNGKDWAVVSRSEPQKVEKTTVHGQRDTAESEFDCLHQTEAERQFRLGRLCFPDR